MTTVGGIIAASHLIRQLEKSLGFQAEALFSGEATLRDVIDIIPITIKEKLALDRLLPSSEPDFLTALAASDLPLAQVEASKYRRLYSHFPVFTEIAG